MACALCEFGDLKLSSIAQLLLSRNQAYIWSNKVLKCNSTEWVPVQCFYREKFSSEQLHIRVRILQWPTVHRNETYIVLTVNERHKFVFN